MAARERFPVSSLVEKRITWVIGAVLGLTALALPVVIDPAGWDAWRFPKTLVLRASALMLLGLHLIRIIASPKRFDRSSIRRDSVGIGVVVILAWTGLASVFSPQPGVSAWAFMDVAAAFVVFFSARDFVARARTSGVFVILLIPGLINVVVLFLAVADIWYPLVSAEQAARYDDIELLRTGGLVGNRDDVSLYLLVPFCAALGLSTSRRRRLRTIAAFSALLILAGIVVTETITTIGAAMVALWLLAAWIILRAGWSPVQRAAVLLALPVVLAGGFLWSGLAGERLENYKHQFISGNWDFASGGRVGAALAAVSMASDDWLFGGGPGRYPIEYVDRAIEVRDRHAWMLSRWDPLNFDMVHNDYLEIAAEAGYFALISALVLVGIVCAKLWKNLREGQYPEVAMAGLLAMVVISLSALVLFPLQLAAVTGSWALLVGGALGVAR